MTMTTTSSGTQRVALRRIPTAHPLVILGSLATLAGMLYWSYRTSFQEPSAWVSFSVCLLVVSISQLSRQSRSKPRPAPKA